MQQKSSHRLVYKIHTKQLKNSKWNLTLDLRTAIREFPKCVVALNDSQCLRFIREIKGEDDPTPKINEVFRRIRLEKRKPRSRETKMVIRNLYEKLYELQFEPHYVCIIMDSNRDYDRANQGFSINGIKYKRLLGTNGGIKNSTIVYVSEAVYPELKKRMDNGRDMGKALVPAKLEAYQALMCSGSIPLPPPRGFIVVSDCITKFKEDVVLINDENDGEPILTYERDYEIEHNDSDGYGLMTPEYSKIVNGFLNGDPDNTISGFNSRMAWTKGMVFTFDFVEFAEKVADSYIIQDVWGCPRDVRDADVILTESMLKLWDSYDSWEDYKRNCDENHYQFSAAKASPEELENVRDTNYQFLQDIYLSDEDIRELCKQTFDEINDTLGLDWRKSLVYLAGFSLNDSNAFADHIGLPIKALMACPDMINDSFIRRRIWTMLERRIEMAKRGAIRVDGNYAMISGDPYALCQSMFGLEVTGLLKAGEVYHKYWIDKGSDEILCFRAPMTVSNSIRKMSLCKSEEASHWFQYIKTALINNAWDSTCEAMNGSDKDGDTNMCTDNPVLLRNVENKSTIVCMQRKADKKVPTEDDIIAANKLAFNDDIGVVTNHATSMIERRAMFEPGSKEYEALTYRIMCGQLFQQNTIDRAKGIIANPMPSYWYSYRDCMPSDGDGEEVLKVKGFNRRIVASEKPYFMKYVYPKLRSKHNNYIKENNRKVKWLFGNHGFKCVSDLEACESKTPEMENLLHYYYEHMPVGNNPCVVNRMCWLAENEFKGFRSSRFGNPTFDPNILKCGVVYSKNVYKEIAELLARYKRIVGSSALEKSSAKAENDIDYESYNQIIESFKMEAAMISPNKYELCDIVVDLCYTVDKWKSFAWNVAGDTMLENLLRRSNYTIHYPVVCSDDAEFIFAGRKMKMESKRIEIEEDYP